jgi:hypothetical protein
MVLLLRLVPVRRSTVSGGRDYGMIDDLHLWHSWRVSVQCSDMIDEGGCLDVFLASSVSCILLQ